MTDEEWFTANPTRHARIRMPRKVPAVDKQRAVRYLDECELQFRSLVPMPLSCRRIVVYRVPADNPMFDPEKPQLLTIPILLAFEGEIIPDTDEALLPTIDGIMREQIA